MKDPDVPEADAAEQSQEWKADEKPRKPRIPPDVPEADAIEQAQPAPLDEDEDRR